MSARRMWQIRVTVPDDVLTSPDVDALFTAIADAAHAWEPKDRDGWDVDVEAGIVLQRDFMAEHPSGAETVK